MLCSFSSLNIYTCTGSTCLTIVHNGHTYNTPVVCRCVRSSSSGCRKMFIGGLHLENQIPARSMYLFWNLRTNQNIDIHSNHSNSPNGQWKLIDHDPHRPHGHFGRIEHSDSVSVDMLVGLDRNARCFLYPKPS